MSIKIKLPPVAKKGSSNKPILVELSLVAVFESGNDINSFPRPRILGPIIDKISLTFDIEDGDDKDGIVDLFDASVAAGGAYTHASPSTKAKSLYAINAMLKEPSSGEAILVQVGRKKKKSNIKAGAPNTPSSSLKKLSFMRLEFNPDKLGPKGMAFLKKKLGELFLQQYSWKDIAEKGRVTRIDLAADLLYVRSDQLIYASASGGKSMVHYGVSGALETAYLEKKSKSAKVIIYNKRQEQKDKGLQAGFGSINHTRIERHASTLLPLIKLQELKNPFESLSIVSPLKAIQPPELHHHWLMFLDCCRLRGMNKALALLPTNELRGKYKDALAKSDEGIWQPSKIWENWPKRLEKSGLL